VGSLSKRIPVLSFFTGGGFLDLGFEEAGFDVVWTNEFDQDIADMYEHGQTALRWRKNSEAPIARISSRESITKLHPNEVLAQAFRGKSPKIFGVIGGPPCPDFSVGGKNRGHEGDRGKLSQSYVEMICGLKPSFFLMENVPGLVRTTKHRAFLGKLREKLSEHGYVTDLKILNALEYGAPQDRERIFLVGLSKRLHHSLFKSKVLPVSDGWFPYPTPSHPNAKSLPWPGVSKFGAHPQRPRGISEELCVYKLLTSSPLPSELPNGTEGFVAYSDKFRIVDEGDDSRKSFKRLHRYRYSPTACYGNNEVHLHPWEPRRLTVRETLRIQTIPDEYILPSGKPLSIKFKMIGNGVPRKLAAAMAGSIVELFKK
jgi:DNA (cytosine-5)-methyltransferase 1